MQELRVITTVINLLALASSLWLGLYIVTRSLRSPLSWLAALTLWALATFFLSNALLNNIPGNIYIAWLQQLAVLVLPLMLHLSNLLLPDALRSRQSTALARFNRLAIPLAYLIAIAFILIGILPTDPPAGFWHIGAETVPATGAIGLTSRTSSTLYPLFVVYLALVSVLSLWNLWQAREQARRTMLADPFTTFFMAVAAAGLGAAYTSIGTALHLDIPTFPGDLLLAVGIFLVGLAVARYSALVEGRALEKDFSYSLLLVGALTAFYVLVTFILYLGGQVSFVTLVLTIIGTIAANSLFDALRVTLDRFFYQQQFQQLRYNLRRLSQEAGTGQTTPERLQAVLDALCRLLRVEQAFITLSHDGDYRVEATHNAAPVGQLFPSGALTAIESVGLLHAEKKGLPGMRLLIPLAAGGSQIGALVLGARENRQGFSEADLDLIEDLGDQIAGLIFASQKQEENARELNAMVERFGEKERALQLQVQQMLAAGEQEQAATLPGVSEESLLPQVEDGLRHLNDLSFLGEHELGKLRIVQERLRGRTQETGTSLERGKVVAEVLVEAVRALEPEGPEPDKSKVPGREWQPFIILYDSYVRDEPNRDIMSRLYISEGTFNRTRRRALRGISKALAEREQMAVAR